MLDQQLPAEIKSFRQLIALEEEQLLERRHKLQARKTEATAEEPIDLKELQDTKFGIALSGGGIRSATINLGFLKTLNKFGVLEQADYLSTVSGGGYTGAYVQATLKEEGSYERLFADEHIEYMRSRGEYMMPGVGWGKRWNVLVLTVGYLISLAMSWISPLIILALIYIVYTLIGKVFHLSGELETFRTALTGSGVLVFSSYVLGAIFGLHLIFNLAMKYHVGVSRRFNQLESILVTIGLLWLITFWFTGLQFNEGLGKYDYWQYLVAAGVLILAGFFTNPNAVSFHRFYRSQLTDAFLHFTGSFKNARIKHLFNVKSKELKDYLAPYPLINTCLNLQSTDDDRFQGAKASDYFLLSPLYCGAKLTGYVATNRSLDYKVMTLPAATTISAAAVNPGMGMYSNKLLSIMMTLLNARLGFWVANPLKPRNRNIVWWPTYFFYELFSLIGTNNQKLNISDGGHIENLGVYELLRRKCRLIIAVDAGADPSFSFADLENLTIRARNELGLDIHFNEGETPEDVIRPKPSHGYSEKRFAVASIYHIWEEIKPVDRMGNAITDKDGQKIEVLVNYKNVSEILHRLTEEERQEMKQIVKSLNLRDHVNDILDTLGISNVQMIDQVVKNLTNNQDLRKVFRALLEMLRGVNTLLERKLKAQIGEVAKREEVFRQVIDTIEERVINLLKVGTLVYVKSSITAPDGKPQLGSRDSLAYSTYKYKIYHPSFPHEPTSDQFFDAVQWESYFQLGQFIGAEVLGDAGLETFKSTTKDSFSIHALLAHFDEGESLFKKVLPSIEKLPPSQVLETMEQKAPERVPAAPREAQPAEDVVASPVTEAAA